MFSAQLTQSHVCSHQLFQYFLFFFWGKRSIAVSEHWWERLRPWADVDLPPFPSFIGKGQNFPVSWVSGWNLWVLEFGCLCSMGWWWNVGQSSSLGNLWFVPTVTGGRWLGRILQFPILHIVAGLQYSCDLTEIKYVEFFFCLFETTWKPATAPEMAQF